jgi:hypothetical protein
LYAGWIPTAALIGDLIIAFIYENIVSGADFALYAIGIVQTGTIYGATMGYMTEYESWFSEWYEHASIKSSRDYMTKYTDTYGEIPEFPYEYESAPE